MRRTSLARSCRRRPSPANRVRRSLQARFEFLEPRLLLTGNPDGGDPLNGHEAWDINPAAITYSTQADGMPILNSNSSATATIFLDFNAGSPTYLGASTGFDIDGDPTTYNASEQRVIVEAWKELSTFYAVFNVNVTTIKPADLNATPTAWVAVGNNFGGGQTIQGTFPNRTQAESIVPSDFAENRPSGIAHEIGHNFGLTHTASYDSWGYISSGYEWAPDLLHGPIMGYDYSGVIHKWTDWHAATGDWTATQDDMAVISGAIAAQVGGTGYRADDYGNTIATATSMTTTGTTQWAAGDLETVTDVDSFSFTVPTGGGTYNITAGRYSSSGADLNITLYNSSSTMLASDDGGDPQSQANSVMVNDSHLTVTLGAGTYYIIVQSHGNYDDQGSYVVRVDPEASGWTFHDVGMVGDPGYASYASSTGTFTDVGGGSVLGLTADSFGFLSEVLSGDGSITARVTGMGLGTGNAEAGVMIRQSTDQGAVNVMTVLFPTSALMQWRATANTTSSFTGGPATTIPYWVKLSRAGNVFTSQVSSDGTTWTTIGTQTVVMTGNVLIGLVSTDQNNRLDNMATFDHVTLTGTINPTLPSNSLTAPGTLTVGTVTSTSVALSWTNISGESGYIIERSSDGINFSQVGSTATNVVTWTDNATNDPTHTPLDDLRYYYRVRATAGSGGSTTYSNPSPVKNAVTRAGVVTNLREFLPQPGSTARTIDWTDTSGETSYTVQRSTNGTSGWTTVGSAVSQNHVIFTNTGVTAGTSYYYRVETTDASGVSATSGAVGVLNGLAFTTKASNNMAFSWTAFPGATGYLIERSSMGNSFSPDWTTLDANHTTTSFSDTTVSPLTEYYYRVTPIGGTISGSSDVIYAASPAAAALPSPWTQTDIGSPFGTGAAGDSNGSVTVIGGGAMIGGTSDQFHYAYLSFTGDGWIQARVNSFDGPSSDAEAGVMIRQTTAAGDAYVMTLLYTGNNSQMQWRSSSGGGTGGTGGPSETPPAWIKVSRVGNVFTSQVSSDDITWSTVGTQTVTMTGTVTMGLAVTSGSQPGQITGLATDLFDHVSTSVLALTAPTGLAFTTKASNNMAFSWSAVTNATGYTVERSTDGSTWTTLIENQAGTSYSDTTVTPVTEYYYRVTAIRTGGVSPASTPIFAASPAASALSSPWTQADIGSPTGSGAAKDVSGTFTVIGGGTVIGGSSDQFDYAYLSFTGDGWIQARVTAQDPSSPISEAGVMIRQSTAANSANAMTILYPGNNSQFQWRSSAGGGTTGAGGPTATVPYWIKISRVGNVFTSQVSSDGTTWTQVGTTQTITMTGTVLMGLAVTAGSGTLLSTDVFDNVSTSVTGLVTMALPHKSMAMAGAQSALDTSTPSSLQQLGGGSTEGTSTLPIVSPIGATMSLAPTQMALASAAHDYILQFDDFDIFGPRAVRGKPKRMFV